MKRVISQYKPSELARYNTHKLREKNEEDRLEKEILDFNNAENLSTNIPTNSNASKETKSRAIVAQQQPKFVKKATMFGMGQKIIENNFDQKPDVQSIKLQLQGA